jgi:DNA adenine methylase
MKELSPRRPALRYHGGKWRLAPWIIRHFPAHRTYVEPYGGAASVLLQKRRAYGEVYNDIWDEAVSLFRVLRDPEQAACLERQLRLTPFARQEFYGAYTPATEPIERARRLLIRSFMGHGSASANADHLTGFRNDAAKSGTTPARDWQRWPDNVRALTNRLQGVCIEHRPALDIIREFDSPETLIFADPPYPRRTRSAAMTRSNNLYHHEMTDDDHRALAEVLRSVDGMAILCGYRCPLYDVELYPDWVSVECQTFADGAIARTEVLWLSPAVSRQILPVRQGVMDL